MNIILLGAGQVGSTLAEYLVKEHNNITIVDRNPIVLDSLRERFDVGVVLGHAAYPRILEAARASDADMIIAVTDSDETNMIACQIAHTFFKIPTKIARVRSLEYLFGDELYRDDALPIDVVISPEYL